MQDYVSGSKISDDEAYMVLDTEGADHMFFEESVKCAKWRQAMDVEINFIVKNKTWPLIDFPTNYKRIGVKWIYITKKDEKVRMIISVATQNGWNILQLEVKSSFLHRELVEDVYIEQPREYESKGNEHMIYKLHKALYGLKQAPRTWFSRIEKHFLDEGFEDNKNEHTPFTKRSREGRMIIVSLYVDDLIITGDDEKLIAQFKSSLIKQFDMTNLGGMSYFLEIEVTQRDDGIFICQKSYVEAVLKSFGMVDCNPLSSPISPGLKVDHDRDGKLVDNTLYKQMVGSLMLRKNTKSKAEGELMVYRDSDYARDIDDRKSTSGYVFLLNSGAVAWCSKKQPIVILSTTEAEFVAATTKALKIEDFVKLRTEVGMVEIEEIS
ncbi:transmembrane signal receptor [Lithospermum erythrorhizon]|uniref:Transmembrane signal receptor n=1 Tax=Lithospermum erythrorhizon TaxID=34254 RepID=A0AAV3PF88_LITER